MGTVSPTDFLAPRFNRPTVDVAVEGGRLFPGEVFPHTVESKLPEVIRMFGKENVGFSDRLKESLLIGFIEKETCATGIVFAELLYRIQKAAGGTYNGRSAVFHGVHLAQATRFKAAGHNVRVRTGKYKVGKPVAESQVEAKLSGVFMRQFFQGFLQFTISFAEYHKPEF